MINEQIECFPLDIALSTEACFDAFASTQYAMLLDSANSEHENGRYDIIVAWPKRHLEARNGEYLFDGKAVSCAQTVMNEQLAALSTKNPFDVPFCGGWVGYFSYDLGRYLETMPSKAVKDIDLPELFAGLYVDALIFDKQQQKWFYVCQPNFNRLDLFLAQIAKTQHYATFALQSQWRSNLSETDYSDRFLRIHEYLKSGDCYQINLAQRFSADFEGSPWLAYKKLRIANRAPFSAYINHPDGAILSVSPERFIKVTNKQVETKPIKGTLPRGKNEAEDTRLAQKLKNSSKDQAENVMIVDLLRNDLGKVAKPGSVQVPKLFDIESFPAVHHLVSTVTSLLADDKTPLDQLFAAFPGGSITGAPKIRAMEIIEELEPHRRSIYCGSIGYVSACGKMDTSITIRTLVAQKNTLYCWAGGGIVMDSNCQMEYQETLHKVNKILPLLAQSERQ
ncbi:Para-aminobenzoate synthase, aminase component [Pseudoalteromonas luteoviolacea B = ATCC 29581]|nr:Para-aminobenzoate synthase, aminase component [Pseudoalteromonas luteoviolacea B = ATCC 29581]